MDKETAVMLTQAIAVASGIAIDSRNKLTALEILLQKENPELFQEYTAILERVRKNPPTSPIPEGFVTLEARLSRPDQ